MPQIQAELAKVEKLWDTTKKYYMDVTKGNLPVIVFVTADKIMNSMNRVTAMYAGLAAVKKS